MPAPVLYGRIAVELKTTDAMILQSKKVCSTPLRAYRD
jgi:hypothetical protein